MKKQIIISTLACVLMLPGSFSLAADQDREQAQDQVQVYGSQLMTEQERNEYRNKIRAAKTAKEREQIRHEHHQLMTKRAKKQGVTLPDEPPAMDSRRGMEPRGGMGPREGMGSGGGAGGGRGR
jgi:uncharacterized membrane protein